MVVNDSDSDLKSTIIARPGPPSASAQTVNKVGIYDINSLRLYANLPNTINQSDSEALVIQGKRKLVNQPESVPAFEVRSITSSTYTDCYYLQDLLYTIELHTPPRNMDLADHTGSRVVLLLSGRHARARLR